MSWLRVDDNETEHPKIVALDAEAFRLYHNSRLYAARHLTDGLVPRGVLYRLTRLAGPELEAAVTALLRVTPPFTAGLWERDGEDFRIHDYLDYNPSREEGQATREVRSLSGRRGGLKSAAVRRARAEANREANAQANGEATAQAKAQAKLNPVPSRPVPGVASLPLTGNGTRHGSRTPRKGRPENPPPPPRSLQATTGPDRVTSVPAAPLRAQDAQETGGRTPIPAPPVKTPGRPRAGDEAPDSSLADAAQLGQAIHRAVQTYCDEFQRAHRTKPILVRSKDIPILTRLVKERGADEVCGLLTAFFQSPTRFSREQAAWTVGAFSSQYNKLLALRAEGSL